MPKDDTYPLVPVLSLLSSLLIFIPFLEHGFRRTLNSGVAVFALWVLVMAVEIGIEAIVWSGSVDSAPVWCDIATRINLATLYSFPACPLLIFRRLYHTTKPTNDVFVNKRTKVRKLVYEITLGLLLPFIFAGLCYIVQARRFIIVEDFGCESALRPIGATILLTDTFPIFFPLLGIVLYVKSIIRPIFRPHLLPQPREGSREFDPFAHRNFTLGCAIAIAIVPIGIMGFILDVKSASSFWPGWAVIHRHETPKVMPASEWMHSRWEGFGFHFSQWINTLFAICFFATYGTTPRMFSLCHRTWFRAIGRGKVEEKGSRVKTLPDGLESYLASMQYAFSQRTYQSTTTTTSESSAQHPVVHLDDTSSVELDSIISVWISPPMSEPTLSRIGIES